MEIKSINFCIVLSSPSGAGKTSISKKLLQKDKRISLSVSCTTRSPRDNEVDGVDYNFVSEKKFKELIKKDSFYEYAKIFENYYGTLKTSVDAIIKDNDILFDIDWQGTKQLSKFKKLNLIKIFLLPESKEELKKRLIKRNQNTESEIKKRFESFDKDIVNWNDYDFILINKSLEVCFKQIETIINNYKKFNFPSHTAQ